MYVVPETQRRMCFPTACEGIYIRISPNFVSIGETISGKMGVADRQTCVELPYLLPSASLRSIMEVLSELVWTRIYTHFEVYACLCASERKAPTCGQNDNCNDIQNKKKKEGKKESKSYGAEIRNSSAAAFGVDSLSSISLEYRDSVNYLATVASDTASSLEAEVFKKSKSLPKTSVVRASKDASHTRYSSARNGVPTPTQEML